MPSGLPNFPGCNFYTNTMFTYKHILKNRFSAVSTLTGLNAIFSKNNNQEVDVVVLKCTKLTSCPV